MQLGCVATYRLDTGLRVHLDLNAQLHRYETPIEM